MTPNALTLSRSHAPRQLCFDLATAAPLVPAEAVMAIRPCSAEEFETLVDTGKLGWCFNIALSLDARREIRVLRDSLLGQAPTLPDALEIILGHAPRSDAPTLHAPTLRAKWLARRFTCSPSHIINLIEASELKTIGTPAHVKASPQVTRASAETFLRSRVEGDYPELYQSSNRKKFGL